MEVYSGKRAAAVHGQAHSWQRRPVPQTESRSEPLVAVLAITPADRVSLGHILDHSKWKPHYVAGCRDALLVMRHYRFAVVICEPELPDGNWKDVLSLAAAVAYRPPVLVASHPEDRLWTEVLNLGGYDLLVKPFRHEEVIWKISHAWHHWRYTSEIGTAPPPAA